MVVQVDALHPQHALICVMMIMSAVDRNISDRELGIMGQLVRTLPVFDDFDPEEVVSVSEDCARLLQREDGLNQVLARVARSLSPALKETAYALAVELAAVDGSASQEELRLLELIRHSLPVDRLIAAGIERGARARYHRQ